MILLIHEADPQLRSVMITIFTHGVRLSVTFQNLAKQNNFQVRIVVATSGSVDLAVWITDDSWLENVISCFSQLIRAMNDWNSPTDKLMTVEMFIAPGQAKYELEYNVLSVSKDIITLEKYCKTIFI